MYAHPTMTQVTDGRFLGQYATPNGYCYCPVVQGVPQTQCRVLISDGQSDCSLIQTIQALLGAATPTRVVWEPSTRLLAPRPCTMQLDWPNLPIPLRDGSTVQGDTSEVSDRSAGTCHVLDRLSPFQFKYTADASFPTLADSTHGVCQTRRVGTVTIVSPVA